MALAKSQRKKERRGEKKKKGLEEKRSGEKRRGFDLWGRGGPQMKTGGGGLLLNLSPR